MFRKCLVLIGISLTAAFAISGCGGGSGGSSSFGGSGGSAPVSVSVASSASTVDGTDSVTLTASVANDSQSQGVTWSVSGAGTLSNTTAASATYTAPEATASAQSVTVTAKSVKDTTASATATITVPAAPAITTVSSALAGNVGTAYSVQLTGSGGISPLTWTVASGNTLPAGLSLSTAGVLSGMPMAAGAGTTNVAFVMKDSGTPNPLSQTQTLGITIAAAPAIAFSGIMPATVNINAAYAGSAAAGGGTGTLTYSLNSGALPAGLTLNPATGAVAGTTTVSGTYNFTIKAADAFGDSATQAYQIVVGYTAVTIAQGAGNLPLAITGQAYSQTLTASGGSGAGYVWTVSGLSNGLTSSANGATLTISGPATTTGTVNFTAMVTDGAGDSSSPVAYTIQIYSPVTLPSTIPATLASTAYLNWVYSGTVVASGGSGDDNWTVTGQTDGLTTSSSGFTLAVSGTPSSPGTISLNVSVKDTITGLSAGPYTYTITVPNTVTLPDPNPATLGPAVLGTPYSGTILAVGGSGNYSWSVTGLPSDSLNYSTSGGTMTISGTPGSTGTVSFAVSVKDTTTNFTEGPYTYGVTVYNPLTLPTPNPVSLPSTATVNTAYSGSIAASGGSGSGYTYTVTGLPANGLGYLSSGGTLSISGTPANATAVSFAVSVKDSLGFKAGPVTYTVTPYNTVTLPMPNPSTLGPTIVSTPYTGTIVATGGSGNYSWTVTGLPADSLSFSATGGTLTISGTPGTTGTVSFGVSVKDTSTNFTIGPYTYSVNVYNPLTLPTPNPASLPATATVNLTYTGTIVAVGGSGSGYTYTVTGLPANGLSYSSSGGELIVSGTPATTTAISFAVSVKDSLGYKAGPVTYTITPYASVTLPAPNPATLGSAVVSTPYTGNITAVGGSGNYTWTVTGLPSDSLSYSASGSTLIISGTPPTTGTVSFGVSVKDNTANATVGPFTYSVNVYNPLTLPTPNPVSLPSIATVNLAYSGTIAASGGSGSGYTFTVTGLPANGLSYSSSGSVLTISGTPATTTPVSFAVTVKDSAGLTAGPLTYTITPYNTLTLPAPNPASLGGADANSIYSGTIIAAGGSGNYAWTVTGLPADSLSYSASGGTITVSGTPTAAATVSFNVTVKDTTTNTTVGPYTYAITVYSALALPAPDPVTLPSTGYTGVAYSGTINGSGGSGAYSWTVTGLSDNLSPSSNGATLTIGGTPGATPATVTFNVRLTDAATNASITQNGYSVAISIPPPVVLPAPNPASLPSGTVNQLYAGSIVASGGVSPYTWSIDGVPIPNTGAAVLVSNGLSVSSNGGTTLSVGGTPTAVETVDLTNVTVTDSVNSSQTNTYTIAINGTFQVTGQIALNSTCGSGSSTVPTVTLNLLTSPGGTVVQTVTTDDSGNYTFTNILNGTYTIAPSIAGPSSVFYPATQIVTVNNSDVSGENFNVALGYTVSGTVSYGGSNTGQIYLALVPPGNCGTGGTGTSISAPGAFTIRGVPPGTYTLRAWMDLTALGNGAQNTFDPSGNAPVTVSNANVTGAGVTLADNTPSGVPGANPAINGITPTDQGVIVSFKAITSNGVEAATSYDVQWSTAPDFSASPVIYNFKAVGTGSNVWILNNGISSISGTPFTNGQTYYFEARARNAAGPAAGWTIYGGSTTPTGVIVGASTTGNEVQGAVTIPASITPTGPLYVGYYNQSTNIAYGARIASPGTSNPFTVYVPTDTNNDYVFFEILDQNNDGLIDAGDVTNTNNNNPNGISIAAPLTGQNLTLSTVNSTATVSTQYYQYTFNINDTPVTVPGYNLSFDIREGNKLPVAVTLMAGSNVINPVDIGNYCQGCGSVQFQYFVAVNSDTPNIGDAYSFKVTYSDGSTETITGSVTGWNGTASLVGPNDVPTDLQPGFIGPLRPNFSWIDPPVDSSDTFSFYLADSNGNTVWQVPVSNSRSNGFSSSITSLNWGVDPTNAGNDLAPGTILTDGAQYTWQISAQDSTGNQVQASVYFMASGIL